MHLVDMVYFWARTTPRRAALIQPNGIVTYLALAQAIEAAAEYFAANVLDRSKPVTVAISTPSKMLVASLGLLRAGHDVIMAGKMDLAYLPIAESNTLVYERGEAPPDGRTNILFNESWLTTGPNISSLARPPLRQLRTRNGNIFFFTSGTTGRPKRIVRTQAAWEQRILFNGTSAFTDYERALIVTTPASAFGFTRAYEVLYAGKTACFAAVGQPLLWLANTYGIDLLIASPHQALALAELQEKVTRYPLAALRTVRLGGSVISPDGIERIRNQICRNVVLAYSSTEAGIVATAPYEMIAHIKGAVGFIIPEAEVEIVDAEDRVLPIGSEGFVRVRSRQFLLNFGIDDPKVWFYPGDFGWLTEEGVLCIAGRKGDVLNRGGAKLLVADLEKFLLSCPGVMDAGVCSTMGAAGYEEIWVALVFAPSIDMAVLRQQIEESAQFGGSIDRLFVVEAIPRGQLGKIQREQLKQMLQAINDDSH
ncbi:MAG TPA: fatty acid--CoA ligase family protein [Xanthobacteraceae bacterium]|jgi:acyl-coenzyme A synthetase/AMP-(fatty) acid ligase|nr:fatty acid--CoA ligase family protein [Xanthobacteraceae bacterium]